MEDQEALATGLWCNECHTFEDHNYGVSMTGGDCQNCGCPESSHVDAVMLTE